MRSAVTQTEQSNADALALLSAVEDGDAARVRSLLTAGSLADASLRGGETLLMRAATRGHEDVACALLDAGADVNARRADGFTPLVLAVFFSQEEVVRLLIERGADVSAQTRLGTTAESWAASRGFASIAELLRSAEAARPRFIKEARVEAETNREDVKGVDAVTVKASEAEILKVFGALKSTDDVEKFSRATTKPDEAGASANEASMSANIFVRHDGHVPAHPSASAFRLGDFLRSWQGSVGTALLLTAVGVAVFAVWGGNRSRSENPRPAQAAQTPAPQMPAPDTGNAVTQPSALPTPTPDALVVMPAPVVPPGAIYPAPGASAQPFYVPPAATNAPSVPVVVSESGAPPNEDAARSRRKADAATDESANQPSSADNQNSARADDGSRSGSSNRSARTPVTESQPAPPPVVRSTPAPVSTPERGKVIQWPPQ